MISGNPHPQRAKRISPRRQGDHPAIVRSINRRRTDRSSTIWRKASTWSAQIWLTMFFIGAGFAKLTEPMTNLDLLLGWSAFTPDYVVRSVGALEMGLALAVCANLVLFPAARRLTVVAGAAAAVIATAMGVVHLARLEWQLAAVNLCLLMLAMVVVRRYPAG